MICATIKSELYILQLRHKYVRSLVLYPGGFFHFEVVLGDDSKEDNMINMLL